jgi:hypothetical protein
MRRVECGIGGREAETTDYRPQDYGPCKGRRVEGGIGIDKGKRPSFARSFGGRAKWAAK